MRGFTLIHLTVTCCLVGLIFTLSVPSFITLYDKIKLESTQAQVLQDLQLARMQAIKNRKKVVLCASVDGAHCSENWHDQYLLGLKNHDDSINVIRVARYKGVNIKLNAALKAQEIIFNPDGTSQTQGSLILSSGALNRKLVIIHSGRVRS